MNNENCLGVSEAGELRVAGIAAGSVTLAVIALNIAFRANHPLHPLPPASPDTCGLLLTAHIYFSL